MLGPPKTRDLDRPVLISVESSVPQDHFYRNLHRSFDAAYLERVHGYHATEEYQKEYQKAMRKRKVWIEPGAPWAAAGR